MSNYSKNPDVRLIQAGRKVSRAAATLPQTVAAGATGNLFTVTGGRVLLNALVGNVVTALGSTAQTLALGVVNTSTVGGTSTTCLATAGSVTSCGVNAVIAANPGGALQVSPTIPNNVNQAGVGAVVNTTNKAPWVMPAGNITATTSVANSPSGTVTWDLLYTPLDDGASVAAA